MRYEWNAVVIGRHVTEISGRPTDWSRKRVVDGRTKVRRTRGVAALLYPLRGGR